MDISGKMEILYRVHNGLYVNLTNKCPCACTFCLRQSKDAVGQSNSLWLEHEPTFNEVRAAFGGFDMKEFEELVFCGFGEPTEALPVLLQTAEYAKERFDIPTRINTNGLGNLIWGRDITPEFEGLIDCVSISLNTPDKEAYMALARPKFKEKSFEAMLDFARRAVTHVSEVVMTTVSTTISKEQEEECRRICESLGARYRIREFE